jgi:flagellar hook-associated protein 2
VGSNLDSVYALLGAGAVRSVSQSVAPGNIDVGQLSSRYIDNVSLSSLGKARQALSDFRQALQPYAGDAARYPVKVSSSDDKIVSATGNAQTTVPEQQTVIVNQLATAQQVETSPSSNAVVGTGRLTIQLGRVSASGFQPAGDAKSIIINPADASPSGIAARINQAGAGISASVVSDSNGSRLRITGTQTGEQAAFRIQVSDDDGSNANNSGLSQLAFTPGAAAGGATQTQAAQNASVTVDGRTIVAASNTVADKVGGTVLTLNDTGSARLDLNRDTAALSASLKGLVAAYNTAQKQLAQAGGDQAGQSQALLAQAAGQLSGLSAIGVSRAADGSLQVNEKALASALAGNPDQVGTQLATAEQTLDQAAQRAQGTNLGISLRPVNSLLPASLQALNDSIGPYSLLRVGGFNFALNSRTLYGLSQYLTVAGL